MSLTGGAGIMGGSSMYTEASEYGVGNASTFTGGSGTDPWSRPTGHGGGMDSVGGFSVGGTSSSANDARSISTQVSVQCQREMQENNYRCQDLLWT